MPAASARPTTRTRKGQYPNGTDHNAGYECDRNHGIGRSNPAHTGCTSGGTTDCTTNPDAEGCTGGGTDCTTNPDAEGCTGGGTDCTTNPDAEGCTGGGPDCTTNPDMEGCSSGGPECTALPDLPECVNTGNECTAATATDGTCTSVLGEKQTRTPTTPSTTNVLGENLTRTPTAALPFTGANIALMSGIALLTMLFGGGLVLAARRRKSFTS